MWMVIAMIAGCEGEGCEVPGYTDAGPLSGLEEPCSTVWDCTRGLTCTNGRCVRPPSAPQTDAYVWADAYDIVDATPPDAENRADAALLDATASDASAAPPPTMDAGP
jgi:hypothetical protein